MSLLSLCIILIFSKTVGLWETGTRWLLCTLFLAKGLFYLGTDVGHRLHIYKRAIADIVIK